MKRIIVLFLCLGLIGCATSRLDGYRNKNISVSKTFPYAREIVYEKALEVSKEMNLIVRETKPPEVIYIRPNTAELVLQTAFLGVAKSAKHIAIYLSEIEKNKTRVEVTQTLDSFINEDLRSVILLKLEAKLGD